MSNFVCDCSADYDGLNCHFHAEEIRTARKEHKCCECHEKIIPGKKYEYARGNWEGEFLTYKTCMRCKALRDKHCSGGWIYGELFETLWNCMQWDPRTEFGKFPEKD